MYQNILSIILSLLLPCFALAQTHADTTFIYRKVTNHAIYIDSNKNSAHYATLLDFNYEEDDTYNRHIQYLKGKYKIPFKKQDLTDVPRQWVPIHLYGGNHYLYMPCDFINRYLLSFTENAVIDYTGEGVLPGRINTFKRMDNSTYTFTLDSWFAPLRTLTLHIIDRDKGLAVIEETQPGEQPFYMLMVSAEKALNYPIIVNDCRDEKQDEYEFEKPDFETLLSRR